MEKHGILLYTIALLSIAIGIYLNQDNEIYPSTTSIYFPAHEQVVENSPQSLWMSNEYVFGRWKKPIHDIQFHYDKNKTIGNIINEYQGRIQTKRWHYTSINTEKYFIAFAIVSLNYASPIFLYVVDKITSEKWEYGIVLPGWYDVTFAETSTDSSSCTSYSMYDFRICYNHESSLWHMHATSIPLTSESTHEVKAFSFDLKMSGDGEPLILSFPLANDPMRPAYVHKGAGSDTKGYFIFGDQHVDVKNGLGAIDWTKSLALRQTIWNWASSSFYDEDGNAIGINLSRNVYDIDQASQENAIWINGKLCLLGGVDFIIPKDPLHDQWTIQSTSPHDENLIELTFQPEGSRMEKVNVLNIMRSDFVQPYGRFSGRIKCSIDEEKFDIFIRDAFGVVEDHFALW